MRATTKLSTPEFAESVMLLSELYLNIHPTVDLVNPVIDDELLRIHLKQLSNDVLRSYIEQGLSNLPIDEQMKMMSESKSIADTATEFVTQHTKVPIDGESMIMEKTRNVTGFSELFQKRPEIIPFLKALHALWYRKATE
jgi:hypothetical protein